MSPSAEPGVVFLTAPPADAARILAAAASRFPDVRWTVVHRERDADDARLGNALGEFEALSDKPSGSKLAFVRELRARRFGTAVVAWTGDAGFDRMKLVALLAGARRYLIYDERLESFALEGASLLWIPHARVRVGLGAHERSLLLSLVGALYKWTLGLAFGGARLALRLAAPRAGDDPAR